MEYITKLKLAAAHQWCDVEDKSTEFLIVFLQYTVGVDFDCVMSYLQLPEEELDNLRQDLNNLLEWFEKNEEYWII